MMNNSNVSRSQLPERSVHSHQDSIREENIQSETGPVNQDLTGVRERSRSHRVIIELSLDPKIKNNIVEVCYDPSTKQPYEKLYEDSDFLQFIRSHCELISDKLVVKLLSEIVSVLYVMHSRGYVHRDIKPLSILTDRQGEYFHFRLAGFRAVSLPKENAKSPARVGTREFWAPEILRHSEYSVKSDIFALAMTIMVALLGHFESYGDQPNCGWDEHVEHQCQALVLSPRIRQLLVRMLSEDPRNRPTAEETLGVVSTWSEQSLDDYLEAGNALEVRPMV